LATMAWVAYLDETSGKTYYNDTVSGEVTWDKPDSYEAAADAQTKLTMSKYGWNGTIGTDDRKLTDGLWVISEITNGRNMPMELLGTNTEIHDSTITWYTQEGQPSSFEMAFDRGAWTIYRARGGAWHTGKLGNCQIYSTVPEQYPDMLHWDFGPDAGLFTWSRVTTEEEFESEEEYESEGGQSPRALNADVDRVREQYNQGSRFSQSEIRQHETAELTRFMKLQGLSQYESAMRNDLGVTEASDLAYLTAEDLAEIGIKGSKARRFLAEINN